MKLSIYQFAALVALLFISEAPNVTAQPPETRAVATKLDIEELLSYVNKFSVAFIQGISAKRKNGQFVLDPADKKELTAHLVQLKEALGKVNDTGILNPSNLSTLNLQVLQAALECDRCTAVLSKGRLKELPKSNVDMSAFLIVRCDSIINLIEKPPANSTPKDVVMYLETHMFHLRQITNAYLPS